LIKRGADLVSTKSSGRNTPLHVAVLHNRVSVAQLILKGAESQGGAKVKELLASQNVEGLTPLDEAKLREGHAHPAPDGTTMIQLLDSYATKE